MVSVRDTILISVSIFLACVFVILSALIFRSGHTAVGNQVNSNAFSYLMEDNTLFSNMNNTTFTGAKVVGFIGRYQSYLPVLVVTRENPNGTYDTSQIYDETSASYVNPSKYYSCTVYAEVTEEVIGISFVQEGAPTIAFDPSQASTIFTEDAKLLQLKYEAYCKKEEYQALAMRRGLQLYYEDKTNGVLKTEDHLQREIERLQAEYKDILTYAKGGD